MALCFAMLAGIFSLALTPDAAAQMAVGEINGTFSSGSTTSIFHGYMVFLETPSDKYSVAVTNPTNDICFIKNKTIGLMPVYQWAQQAGTFLALNGSFFNPESEFKPGDCRQAFGPVKSGGALLVPLTKRPDGKGNPALLFSANGTASIKMATSADVSAALNVVAGQWEAGPALGSNGSLLVENGILKGDSALPVPTEIAPRTAVGLTKNGTLIVVMIEGRLPGSDGITLPYLAQLLQIYGAYNAINLDGGGSSTITYMPDLRVHMQETSNLYTLMKSNQTDTSSTLTVNFAQRDPRIPFTSRPSDLFSSSDSTLLYRPVAIHFGFVAQP